MSTLFAFGDSFVVGDQDDFLHELPRGVIPTHNMKYDERIEFLKYNISFVSILAKNNNYELKNFAERGSGNFPQLDLLMTKILAKEITQDDKVFFGLTTFTRDRVHLLGNKHYKRMYKDRGRGLIHQDIGIQLLTVDYIYVMNTLTFINDTLGIPVVAINLFDSVKYSNIDYKIQIGCNKPGNTLINILNDTWGTETEHPYHTFLKIPKGYEDLYSKCKHPSIKGHQKIADWLQKLNTI